MNAILTTRKFYLDDIKNWKSYGTTGGWTSMLQDARFLIDNHLVHRHSFPRTGGFYERIPMHCLRNILTRCLAFVEILSWTICLGLGPMASSPHILRLGTWNLFQTPIVGSLVLRPRSRNEDQTVQVHQPPNFLESVREPLFLFV